MTDSAVDESLQYSVLVVVVGFLFLCFFFFLPFQRLLCWYIRVYMSVYLYLYIFTLKVRLCLVCSRCRRLRCHSRKLHLTSLVASMMHREKAISKQQ